jgi:hypothetical protein
MGPHKDFSLMGPNFGIMGKPTAPVKYEIVPNYNRLCFRNSCIGSMSRYGS